MLPEPAIGAFIACLGRAGGLVATAPVVGEGGVPARAKLVLVVAIAGAISVSRPGVALADVPLIAVFELAIGVLSGLVARFAMAPIAIAGQLAGLSLGLGFAAEYDARANESAGTLRAMVTALGGLAFLAAGGLEAIVRCAAAGPATPFAIPELGTMAMDHAMDAMGRGLTLAAPVVLAALVGNIGFALINRAVPAANVFAIALAAVLLIGGAVLLATAPTFVGNILDIARSASDQLANP
jgi:flagellar biosynthesis protein FliR